MKRTFRFALLALVLAAGCAVKKPGTPVKRFIITVPRECVDRIDCHQDIACHKATMQFHCTKLEESK